MILFLLVYVVVYGGAHYWIFKRLDQAYSFKKKIRISLILFLWTMMSVPLLLFWLERATIDWLTIPLAWLGFSWMGILFMIVTAFLCMNILKNCGLLIKRFLGIAVPGWWTSKKVNTTVALFLALAASVASVIESQQLTVETITLTSKKLPTDYPRVRIVQVSDLHIGLIVNKAYVEKVIAKIAALQPDMIVCTGDMVDAQVDGCAHLAKFWTTLQAPLGKYAVMGNHEFYPGVEKTTAFIKAADFLLLRGEARTVKDVINLAGVDDRAGKYFKQYREVSESKLLRGLSSNRFTLLLKHRPEVDSQSVGLFDLQLSGHTHKGQLFPFNIFTRLAFKYHSGFYELKKGSCVYTSRGTGTWGPPMRLLAPPELTVIDLVSDK